HLRVQRTETEVVVQLVDCSMLNDENAPEVKAELNELVAQLGPAQVLLDLSNVTFMSSDGLGTLMVLHSKLCAAGGHLTICNASPAVMEILEITQVTRLLDVRPTDSAGTSK